MKTKEEILKQYNCGYVKQSNGLINVSNLSYLSSIVENQKLLLEVLLDIREGMKNDI